jgi:RNA polymerase primary sigma factor
LNAFAILLLTGREKSQKNDKKCEKRFAIQKIGIILSIVTGQFTPTHHKQKQRSLTTMGFDAYVSQFTSEQVLSNEQIVVLHNLLKNGCESAREQLVKSNMRLVVKIANDYRNYGMDFEDIVSNGTVGLMKAIEVFDAGKGAFSPCASVWINNYIRMGFDHGRLVHTKRYDRMTVEERSASVVESLNEKIGDGETEFADSFASNEPTPVEKAVFEDSVKAMLKAIDNVLDAREQFIVRARYGLDGNEALTLREIADRLGMTHERVRQIEVVALLKMRGQMER